MTVLGVDAGGTGSRAVVVRNGDVVERLDLGPLNLILDADAIERLAGLITRVGASAAGLGLAGLRSAADAARVAAELTARTGARVAVGDDTDAALAGAFRGGPGVVVIAGTGSGAAGRDRAGRTVRVGGHGFLLGDEGGGYWIGREAVRAALRAQDGTGPPTALRQTVEAAFRRLLDAERAVHERPTDRQLLARLVPAVALAAGGRSPGVPAAPAHRPGTPTAAGGDPAAPAPRPGPTTVDGDPAAPPPRSDTPTAADGDPAAPPPRAGTPTAADGDPAAAGGDPEARRILAEAATHLVDLAEAVRRRLGPLPVAGVGGIFRCAPVRDAFTAATGAVPPAESPELGALRLLDC